MGKQHKLFKAVYGRVTLLKRYCPDCHMYAIIIDDKFGCCGRDANDWDQDFLIRKKRESEVPGRRQPISKKDKQIILKHQNHQCVYCGQHLGKKVRIEYDHFVPFVFSGDNNRLNMVAACQRCNQIKHCHLFSSIEEARVYIINELERKQLVWFDYFGGSYEVSKI